MATEDLLVPVFVSGLLIGAAMVLVEIAEKAKRDD
jgi:hypothetical protein